MIAEVYFEVNRKDFQAAAAAASYLKISPVLGSWSDVLLAAGLASAGKEDEAQRLLSVLDYPTYRGPEADQLLFNKTIAAVQLGLLELHQNRRHEAASALDRASDLFTSTPARFKSAQSAVLQYSLGMLEKTTNLDSAIEHMYEAVTLPTQYRSHSSRRRSGKVTHNCWPLRIAAMRHCTGTVVLSKCQGQIRSPE